MADTAPTYFTSSVTQTNPFNGPLWSNPDYARVDDGTAASVTVLTGDMSGVLMFQLADFGFDDSYTISSVKVRTRGRLVSGSGIDCTLSVAFSDSTGGNGLLWTYPPEYATNGWEIKESIIGTSGNSTVSSGGWWKDNGFLTLFIENYSGTTVDFELDWVEVTVTYTYSPPPPLGTSLISYVGSATGTTSATLPAHQAGDLILVFAYRDGSNTAPTQPAGFTNIASSGGNTNSSRIGYKIAASSAETVGTWTSATSVIAAVYRGVDPTTPIGGFTGGGAQSTTVAYNTVTMTAGSSWVVGVAGHRSVNTNVQYAPADMTNRTSVLDATDEAALHDTNGGTNVWGTKTVSVGGTSSGWRSWAVEIKSIPAKELNTTLDQSQTWTSEIERDRPDIVVVGSAAGVDTATMPPHEVGDYILVYAFRDGSTTYPTAPSLGYAINSTVGTNCVLRVGRKIATTNTETVGTWTNATSVGVVVYRGVYLTAPSGAITTAQGVGTSVNYPTLNLNLTDGESIVVAAAVHTSNDTALETPPTGMVNRINLTDTVDEISIHDTHSGVASWSSQNVEVGGTSGSWITHLIELRPNPAGTKVISTTPMAETEGWAVHASKLRNLSATIAETHTATASAIGNRTATTAITQSEAWSSSSPAKTKNIVTALAEAQTWAAELHRAKTLATTLAELATVTTEQQRTRAYTTLLPQTQAWTGKVSSSRETAKPISTALVQTESVVVRASRLRPLVAALAQAQTILTNADKVFMLATVLAQVESYAANLGRIKQGFSLSAQRQYSQVAARRNRVAATTLAETETTTPRNQRIRNIQTTLAQTVTILTDPVEHLQDQKLNGGVIWGSAQTPHLGVDVYRQSSKQEYVLGTTYIYLNDRYVYVRTAIAIQPRQECNLLSEFIAFPGIGYVHDLEEAAEPGSYIWIRAAYNPLS